jgi:hypothetical protein
MSQIKVEPYDGLKHRNCMWGVNDDVETKSKRYREAPTLAQYNVCLVTVCSFTFEFHDIAQLDACLEYYRRDHQPSSRLPIYIENLFAPHSETQRWFEKLPQYLLEKSKRPKVIAALEKARTLYQTSAG